jgi:hypothetical protein
VVELVTTARVKNYLNNAFVDHRENDAALRMKRIRRMRRIRRMKRI